MPVTIEEQEVRTCLDCGETKPLMRFHRRRVGADSKPQYQSYCKTCNTARAKAHREKNVDWYRYRDREKYTAQKRAALRLRKYGVSQEDFDKMLEAQNNRCAGCLESFQKPQSACVDHDHKTGRVRGLLCDLCNRALGYLRDDPTLARRLAEYLDRGEVQ